VDKDVPQGEVHGKVEGSVEPCIDSLLHNSTGEERDDGRIWIEYLAYYSQVWIDGVKLRMEIVPEGTPHIRKCIKTEAVKSRRLDPPNRILDQVLRNQRIFLVEIRKHTRKLSLKRRRAMPAEPHGVRNRAEVSFGDAVMG
jgi:hypothetical protein